MFHVPGLSTAHLGCVISYFLDDNLLAVAVVTEIRFLCVRVEKQIIVNSNFDRFLFCFQNVFAHRLRKMIISTSNLNLSDSNTIFFAFTNFLSFFAKFNSFNFLEKILLTSMKATFFY